MLIRLSSYLFKCFSSLPKDGFTQFGKACFKTGGDSKDSDYSLKTASEAQQACKKLDPLAELAVLRTKQYEQFATALIKGFRNPMGISTGPWIGLELYTSYSESEIQRNLTTSSLYVFETHSRPECNW